MPGIVAAVGLAQLERIDDYVQQDVDNAQLYHQAIEGCDWLVPQALPSYSTHSQHIFTLAFHGEKQGIDYEEFKRVSREEGAGLGFGYTQRTWKEAQIVAAYQFPLSPYRWPTAGAAQPLPHYANNCPTGTATAPTPRT